MEKSERGGRRQPEEEKENNNNKKEEEDTSGQNWTRAGFKTTGADAAAAVSAALLF